MLRIHRLVRWFVQGLFLAAYSILLMQTRYGVVSGHQNFFFRFDPLILTVTSIALRVFMSFALFSIVTLAATFLFGRFFCGFVCPLGTLIDVGDSLLNSRHVAMARLKNLKYAVLVFLLITALLGGSFLHFFDPLIIMERTLILVITPVAIFFRDMLVPAQPVVFSETLLAAAMFVAIIALGMIASRFWCRNLCPLGGLLAVPSRFSIFKFTFLDSCTQCAVCDRVCPTGALSSKYRRVDSSECIACLRCRYECPHSAISYRVNAKCTPLDISKRNLIAAIGAAVIAVPLSRSLLHVATASRLIRPPGSIPEPEFLTGCLRCGRCMRVCPTNGLQPCVLEAGVNGVWSPRLISRIGGCEKNCNMCGQVCPTGAIRPLPLEEKTFVKMGTAVIDRTRCIAWEQDKVCLVCDEACPYGAIVSKNETIRGATLLRPFADERICTGCGLCEARCPVAGESAIVIHRTGEERMRTGSYVTEDKKRLRACSDRQEDIPSGFIVE